MTAEPASAVVSSPAVTPPDTSAALSGGKVRRGTGLVPLVAQLVAAALIGIGAVGVQETLVRTGLVSGRSWISVTLDAVDGVDHRYGAVLLIGVVLLLLGVLVLRTGLRPRPRLTLTVAAETGVQLRPQDLARLVRTAVSDVGGVATVDVRATHRRVGVLVHSISPKDRDDELLGLVAERLDPVLSPLARKPRLTLGVRHDEV